MPSDTERRIGERYELQRLLGRGGMASVWRARDLRLHRDVAIKEVHVPDEIDGDDAQHLRQRVEREARAAARLSHPSSVTIFDSFEDGNRLYLVMELVDAPTLRDVVSDRGPLAPAQAAQLGLGVLDALDAAHRQGIVHRDVKPGNIMVLPGGGVKLADFGVASIKDHPAITRTGNVSGSPSYMAPEQARGGPSAPPTDLWALGATLYYAVEGVPPFEREAGALATMMAVVHEDPRRCERAGALGPLLGDLLAKEPGDRPPTAEVRHRLEQVAGAEGTETTQVTPVVTAPTRTYVESRPSPAVAPAAPPSPAGHPRRDRWRALAVGLVLLVALAVALVAFATRDDTTAPPGPKAGPTTSPAKDSTPSTAKRRSATTATGDRPDGVPDGWVAYQDATTGYRIWHPKDWRVSPVDRTRTDFRDPSSGAYVRIDWTDHPGSSPEGAWRQQSQSFGASHDGYHEIRIEPTTFKGYDAAIWEFTYREGGAALHAVDLGMVTGPYGFALNFQTHAEAWDSSQGVFEAFKAGFEPVSRS